MFRALYPYGWARGASILKLSLYRGERGDHSGGGGGGQRATILVYLGNVAVQPGARGASILSYLYGRARGVIKGDPASQACRLCRCQMLARLH